jgi:hypothetical protein
MCICLAPALAEAAVSSTRHGDTSVDEKVLDFPIYWAKGPPYNARLPKDLRGQPSAWSCGQVARAMIVRYYSLRMPLRTSGTYFYKRRDTGQWLHADYNVPFQWDRMASTLQGVAANDPRVAPIADFVYRFGVAQRTNWPKAGDGPDWGYTREMTEILVKYFGFDPSGGRFIHFGPFLKEHTWDDLYAIMRKEIDEGRPIYFRLAGHSVVITGYRRSGWKHEFMIHWGTHGGYDPRQAVRIDQPLGRFADPLAHWIWIGVKPDTTHSQLPLYNKLAEVWDGTQYDAWPISTIGWSESRGEYVAVFPARQRGRQVLYVQRQKADGKPVGQPRPLDLPKGSHPQQPVIAWGKGFCGLAWVDRANPENPACFCRLDAETLEVEGPIVRLGKAKTDGWRPVVSLVCSGSEYGVAWADSGKIRFARISAAGSLVPDSTRTICDGIDPCLQATAEGYAIACVSDKTLCFARLDRQGGVLGPVRRINAMPCHAVWTPRLAATPNGFGLAWENVDEPFRRHSIGFCLLDATGAPQGAPAKVLEGSRYIRNPCLSFSNGQFVLTCRRDDAWLVRLAADGKIIEQRYLFWAPEYLAHVRAGGKANVLYLKPHPGEGAVEVESCLFSLQTD